MTRTWKPVLAARGQRRVCRCERGAERPEAMPWLGKWDTSKTHQIKADQASSGGRDRGELQSVARVSVIAGLTGVAGGTYG